LQVVFDGSWIAPQIYDRVDYNLIAFDFVNDSKWEAIYFGFPQVAKREAACMRKQA